MLTITQPARSGTGIITQTLVNPESMLYILHFIIKLSKTNVAQQTIRVFTQKETEKVEKCLNWVKWQGKGAVEKSASTMGPAALCNQGFAYFFHLLLMRTVWSRAHNSHFTNE